MLQIGWGSDSPYDKNIERLNTIRFRVRIAVRFELKEDKKDISRNRKVKIMFPEKLNRVQFGVFEPVAFRKGKMIVSGKLNRLQFGAFERIA
jgi:hypothetical protein